MNFRFSPPVKGIVASIGSLFGRNPPEDEEDKQIYDVNEEGETLFKEDVIRDILEDLEERKQARSALEQQWTLNANFLVGNQYCDMNPYRRGEIEQIEPVYDWLERETFNQIAPLIETRVANLKKIKFMMKVKPATNELDDYAKASVSTTILQHKQKSSCFDMKNNTAIQWNELCGNCFWLAWWDTGKGDLHGIETVIEVGEDGIERKVQKGLYQGDIDYGLVTPYEVYPESIFKQGIEAQRTIILEQVKSVEEIYDLYGIKVDGTTVETFELTPMASGGGYGYENTVVTLGHRPVEDAQKVVTYFERPSKSRPKGRMVIIVGETDIVYYGDLPYSRIPLVQMICREVPGQFFGKSAIEDLIPRQRAYNGCLNRIHEFIKRIALGNQAVEEGSIDIEEYEENGLAPGAFLVYKNGYNPPTPVPNGQLPAEIMAERHNLKADMEYVAGVSQLMVYGATPSGVTSGTAIESLREIDNTRLSLTGDHIREATKQLAILFLDIYKTHASTRRVINAVGTNEIGSALVWSKEDINSYDVEFVTENELLMSEDAQKQRFFEAYNLGLFTDEEGRIPERVKQRALEFMKIGNYTEIMNINELQTQAAQRENSFFENGVIPEVSEFDDHKIHEDEHLRYVLQMDFHLLKMKKPEYAKALEDHIRMHRQIMEQEEAQKMMQAMSLQGGAITP